MSEWTPQKLLTKAISLACCCFLTDFLFVLPDRNASLACWVSPVHAQCTDSVLLTSHSCASNYVPSLGWSDRWSWGSTYLLVSHSSMWLNTIHSGQTLTIHVYQLWLWSQLIKLYRVLTHCWSLQQGPAVDKNFHAPARRTGHSRSWRRQPAGCNGLVLHLLHVLLTLELKLTVETIDTTSRQSATVIYPAMDNCDIHSSVYTVFQKNTHSRLLLYLPEKCLDLNEIFRECLWWTRFSINIKVKFLLLPLT